MDTGEIAIAGGLPGNQAQLVFFRFGVGVGVFCAHFVLFSFQCLCCFDCEIGKDHIRSGAFDCGKRFHHDFVSVDPSHLLGCFNH